MTDDDRNGSRPSIHPVADDFGSIEDSGNMDERARAAIVAKIARRQKLADDEIDAVTETVRRFEDGETEWQLATTRQLQRITDQLQIVSIARIAWPGITILLLIFFGGIIGEVMWRLATSH